MAFFTPHMQLNLAKSLVRKTSPLYVQYYITARCNYRCEQCNIVHAQADAPEMNIHQIRRMAENLAGIGVCMVLLIGGEPFVRTDLPEIVEAFVSNGIHVRMQTNGTATEEALTRCVAAGGHDISISLDSLHHETQDAINQVSGSFHKALRTMALVNRVFPDNGKGFLGTVLMPRNLAHLHQVVEFATRIGWWVSLVPCHTAPTSDPRGFRTFDDQARCRFPLDRRPELEQAMARLKSMARSGAHLYDCGEYLDDVVRFSCGEPVQWRRRNNGVCDSPNLYFAIEPNGDLQPCCDFKLATPISTFAPDFPARYRGGEVEEAVWPYTSTCPGCMYGSYPEITLTARFMRPLLHRLGLFTRKGGRMKPLSYEGLLAVAREVREGRGHDGRTGGEERP